MRAWVRLCLIVVALLAPNHVSANTQWSDIQVSDINSLADDDVLRHANDPTYFSGLVISESKFSEAGFNWHLIRFVNVAKPLGPLWAVPHDDENAAFDAAIEAVKTYGGVAVMVNSGLGSSRKQEGNGTCGGRSAIISKCDPNRNFSTATPLFTKAYTEQLVPGQPIVALHTNTPGHGRGQGDITILDAKAAAKGKIRPRKNGHFGDNGPLSLKDHDTYAIMPFLPPKIPPQDMQCREALTGQGMHVWHERVDRSDGSFSNYVALSMPGTAYVNMESRRETDLVVAAERHRLMIAAYLNSCLASGN
jgi:hypothetical protein